MILKTNLKYRCKTKRKCHQNLSEDRELPSDIYNAHEYTPQINLQKRVSLLSDSTSYQIYGQQIKLDF